MVPVPKAAFILLRQVVPGFRREETDKVHLRSPALTQGILVPVGRPAREVIGGRRARRNDEKSIPDRLNPPWAARERVTVRQSPPKSA